MCWGAWFAAAAEATLAAALLYGRVGAVFIFLAGVPGHVAAGTFVAVHAVGHLTLAVYMTVQQSRGDATAATVFAALAVQCSVAWKCAYAAQHVLRRAPAQRSEVARESVGTLATLLVGTTLTATLLAATALALPAHRGLGRFGLWTAALALLGGVVAYLDPLERLGRNWKAVRPTAPHIPGPLPTTAAAAEPLAPTTSAVADMNPTRG